MEVSPEGEDAKSVSTVESAKLPSVRTVNFVQVRPNLGFKSVIQFVVMRTAIIPGTL